MDPLEGQRPFWAWVLGQECRCVLFEQWVPGSIHQRASGFGDVQPGEEVPRGSVDLGRDSVRAHPVRSAQAGHDALRVGEFERESVPHPGAQAHRGVKTSLGLVNVCLRPAVVAHPDPLHLAVRRGSEKHAFQKERLRFSSDPKFCVSCRWFKKGVTRVS